MKQRCMRLNGNPLLWTLRCSTEDKQTDNSRLCDAITDGASTLNSSKQNRAFSNKMFNFKNR